MDDYPIKVGTMLFTMVDPEPGHEVDYNRWYERDHFYAGCMIGKGWFAGRRWVAPRRLKDLRFPADSPFASPVDAGSYLAIYWVLDGEVTESFAWSSEQFAWLYRNDRGFHHRKHAHTTVYDLAGHRLADPEGVSLALALDHEYGGLVALSVEPVEGVSSDELHRWLEAEAVPGLLAAPDVDQVSSWVVRTALQQGPSPIPANDPKVPRLATSGGADDRVVQLAFTNGTPEGSWDAVRAYAAAVDAGGQGRLVFAAPFIPTIVGTDTYTDELW